MRKIILFGFLLAFAWNGFAQQDAKAKKILDEVSTKMRSLETLSVDFLFTMENKAMEISEKNEGKLELKGQKYRVDLPDVGVKVYSDGETLWNYMEDANQVTVSYLEEGGSELMDPSTVFTIYEKGFRSNYSGEKKEGNKSFHQIELFPDSPEYEVEKILISIDKDENIIKSALLHGTDGNLYGVEVTNLDTDKPMPDSYFVFNPKEYNDIEVIDFR